MTSSASQYSRAGFLVPCPLQSILLKSAPQNGLRQPVTIFSGAGRAPGPALASLEAGHGQGLGFPKGCENGVALQGPYLG